MSETNSAELPRGMAAITSYHAHVYWNDAAEREHALRVRQWIAERFGVAMGRIHDQAVGPHTVPMYQVAFDIEVFEKFAPWLMLNRGGLSVLIHPNTGCARDDHLLHALWLGTPLAVRGDVLPNEPGTDGIDAPVVNTQPTLAAD